MRLINILRYTIGLPLLILATGLVGLRYIAVVLDGFFNGYGSFQEFNWELSKEMLISIWKPIRG